MYNTTVTVGESVFEGADVTYEIIRKLMNGEQYGKYIVLFADIGEIVLESRITDMNADPRTQPFVTLTADAVEGRYKIHSIGLSPDGDFKYNTITIAKPDYLEKLGGEPLSVSIRIDMNITCKSAWFTSGENSLVKWFLLGGELPKARLGIGKNRSVSGQAPPASVNALKMYDAEILDRGSGFAVEAVVNDIPYEAWVYMDDEPVMRVMPLAASSTSLTASTKVSEFFQGFYTIKEIIQITSLQRSGVPLFDYTVTRTHSTLCSAVEAPFKAPAATLIVGDGTCEKAAVVGGGIAMIVRQNGGELRCTAMRRYTGKDDMVRLARDGSLFTFDDGTLTQIDDSGVCNVVELITGDDFEVSCPSAGRYYVAVRNGDKVYWYLIEDGEIDETGTVSAGTGCAIGKIDGKRIMVYGKEVGGVTVGDSSVEYAENHLGKIRDNYSPSKVKFHAHTMFFESDKGNYVSEYYIGDEKKVEASMNDVFVGGDTVMTQDNVYLAEQIGGLSVLENESGESVAIASCRLGDYLVRLKEDGTIDIAALCGVGTMVMSDSFKSGETVTFTYLTPTVTKVDNGIMISITLYMTPNY